MPSQKDPAAKSAVCVSVDVGSISDDEGKLGLVSRDQETSRKRSRTLLLIGK